MNLSPDSIKTLVGAHFGVSEAEMVGPSRTFTVAQARHVAMYLCRQRTRLSLAEIATAFGRSEHGTVIHACQRVEREKYEPEIADALRLIAGRLDGHFVSPGGSVFASFVAP